MSDDETPAHCKQLEYKLEDLQEKLKTEDDLRREGLDVADRLENIKIIQSQIDEYKEKLRQCILSPERKTAPPAAPPREQAVIVNEGYIATIAQQNLPNTDALNDFVEWSREQLPTLAEEVIRASGIDQPRFVTQMDAWLKALTTSTIKLNAKVIPPVPAPKPPPSEPMPGVEEDTQCTSIFDANDLALRGRKSVLVKQFHVPMIFPQILLSPNQHWVFGQKVEYQQEWRHEGFTLGELISSLSLLPNEELTLEVSSWQRTKTEIAEETNTERRERLEREQRRTDEESCVKEAADSNGWTVSATGSVSFGPASASASATATGNAEARSEQAAKHITEATTKPTNEVSLKRAVKMTQTAESGSDQRTTRRIKNPNTCHTVTFNFFQIVKLYDVQLRLENDAPTVMLPGIFPAVYSDGTTRVVIPYWTIEAFTSPAVFLTQYFEVDRDLSEELHGFGLRVRMDAGRSPAAAINQLAEALIVALKYLLKIDPTAHKQALADFIRNYVANTTALRQSSAKNYGVGLGRSEQVTTPGIYADSLLGRCSACEDYVEASRYLDVMRQYGELNRVKRDGELAEQERKRREMLLAATKLEPFEPKSEYALKVDVVKRAEP